MKANRPEDTLKLALLSIETYCLWMAFRLVGGFFSSSVTDGALGLMALTLVGSWYLMVFFGNRNASLDLFKGLSLGLSVLLSVLIPLLLGFGIWNGLGLILFGFMLTIRQFQVFSAPNSILFTLYSRQKIRQVLVVALVISVWLKSSCDFQALALSAMTYTIYNLFEAYWLNIYKWRQKEIEHLEATNDKVSFAQPLGSLERINRTAALGSYALALLAAGGVVVLTKLPILSGVFNFIMWLLISLVGVVAKLMYSVYPIGTGDRSFQEQGAGTAFTTTNASNYQVSGPPPNFETGYFVFATLLLVSIAAVMIVIVVKTIKNREKRTLGTGMQTLDTGKVSAVSTQKSNVVRVDQHQEREKVEEDIRVAYRKLITNIQKRGMAIEKGETADQIKEKLNLIYKDQWDLIEVITEGYCAQRYGNGPENAVEILRAFEQLKEESQ